MTQREKTLKKFGELGYGNTNNEIWPYFRDFYEMGIKDALEELKNPFPIENKDLQSRKEYYFDEELRYFNDLMNKQEDI